MHVSSTGWKVMGSSLRLFASFAAQDCELDSKLKPFAAKIAKRT
jgi:hypothetical protein